ncbi:MAG: sigma-54-dependent transcriptional regulator, partial [Terriglobia bacterium]
MPTDRILIVDDESDMVESWARLLRSQGYQCFATTASAEALRLLESEHPDLLLTDLKMPGTDGMEMLRRAHEIDRQMPVIVLTGHASIESAVAAVKAGAFDYLAKPSSNDQLKIAVERALNRRRLELENGHLREQLRDELGFENIVGRSVALRQTLELVRKAARAEA